MFPGGGCSEMPEPRGLSRQADIELKKSWDGLVCNIPSHPTPL